MSGLFKMIANICNGLVLYPIFVLSSIYSAIEKRFVNVIQVSPRLSSVVNTSRIRAYTRIGSLAINPCFLAKDSLCANVNPALKSI